MPSSVNIKCNTGQTLLLSEIHPFEKNPKKRTAKDLENIIEKIIETGFSFPFFVWQSDKNYCLDGNGRLETLKMLEKRGYEIPELPVVFVEAVNEQEAIEKLLQQNSSYGMITKDGLAEFTEGLELELESLSFADSYLDFSGNVFSEKGDLSPRQNAIKVAVFGIYQIPVSEKEIRLFQQRLDEYGAQNGGLTGFFAHYLTRYSLVKQQGNS
jgi:hypothetical protein